VREETPDFIGAGLLAALGVALALGSVQYGIFNEEGRIGPGFMPFGAGALLALFAVMIGIEAWRRRGVRASRATEEPGEDGAQEQTVEPEDGEAKNRTVALVFGLTLVAILLIPVLGFLLSFGLLVFVLVTFVERGSLLLGAVLGVCAVAFAWLVFVLFLQIPLPQGIFTFLGGG
jgi:hypothetical protein